jgi:hypothetical protein
MTRFLESHPAVFMADRKDIHFFGSDLGFRNRERESEQDYLARFETARPDQLQAESSVWYLYSKKAAAEIAARNPEARILIMLRHPVVMMHALWAQLRLNGLGDEDITDFAEALEAEPERIEGRRIPPHTPLPEALFYRRTARFSEQLQRYRDAFPAEQLHVVIQEEMKADTEATWRGVCEWLQIDADHPLEMGEVNRSKATRSEGIRKLVGSTPGGLKNLVPTSARRQLSRWIRRANTAHAERSAIPDDLQVALNLELQPEIQAIEGMLNREIAAWKR